MSINRIKSECIGMEIIISKSCKEKLFPIFTSLLPNTEKVSKHVEREKEEKYSSVQSLFQTLIWPVTDFTKNRHK